MTLNFTNVNCLKTSLINFSMKNVVEKKVTSLATVSLVVTSCGRYEQLLATVKSFAKTNTYPLKEAVFVEDGGLDLDKVLLASILGLEASKVIILKNATNIGQIASIDRAYENISSDYIFHCEDDWDFYACGFIEASIDILTADKKIFCVWLRAHNDTNSQPIEKTRYTTANGIGYYLMSNNYKSVWSGFTLNPGLRRTVDCHLLHPYAKQKIKKTDLTKRVRVTESDLSIAYGELGYRGAITELKDGYVRHTGYGHHLACEWEFPIWVDIKNLIKRIKAFTHKIEQSCDSKN